MRVVESRTEERAIRRIERKLIRCGIDRPHDAELLCSEWGLVLRWDDNASADELDKLTDEAVSYLRNEAALKRKA